MQIKTSEFIGYHATKMTDNGDNGVWLVEYSTPTKAAAPSIKPAYSYYSSTSEYYLSIPKEQPRAVLRSAIVVKTSANCFKVSYADRLGCEIGTVKTYAELHAFLRPLWNRSLQ